MGRKKAGSVGGIVVFMLVAVLLPMLFSATAPKAEAQGEGRLSGWQYRMKITINENVIDSNLDNFPVTVFLDNTNFNFNHALSTGYDIRFTASDGTTLLSYERERHDKDNGYAEYHVKVPSVSATENTIIYMYYGNALASDGANPTAVWDSNFKAVWHMNDSFLRNAVSLDGSVSVQLPTDTVDGFGLLIKTGDDTIINFTSQGPGWFSGKYKIVKNVYTISTKTWSSRTDVFEDNTYCAIAIAGGVIGDHIYLFFTRQTQITGTCIDMGYIVSTDLTGSSWSSYTPIDVSPLTAYCPYGHLVSTSVPGTYLQPFYGWATVPTAAEVKFFKTTDYGNTWNIGSTIYSGSDMYEETCVEYIGSQKMIALIRDGNGGYVKQTTSSDDGNTWTAVNDTNLGAGPGEESIKVPWIYYDPERDVVFALYHDRHSPAQTKISVADALTVYSSPTAWSAPIVIDSFIYFGYPSMVKTAFGKYFFVYSKMVSSTDADIWGGYVVLTTPSMIGDSTSNNLDGIKKVAGEPVEADAKIGKGQNFDGADDYIKVGDTSTFAWMHKVNEKFTLEFWVAADQPARAEALFDTNGTCESTKIGVDFYKKVDRSLCVFITNGTSGQYVCNATSVAGLYPNDTNLHHIVWTWDHSLASNNSRVYIDGSEVWVANKGTATPSSANSSYPLYIGKVSTGGYLLDGKLDEYRVSSSVRSAAWIKATYNSATHTRGAIGTAPAAPSLVSPENCHDILDTTPTFEWTLSDPSGVTYQIQIDNDNNFGSPVYFAENLAENIHTLPDENALALFVQYFWRVRAKDEAGNTGDWSETWNFEVVPVGAIGVLLMPLLMLLPFALILWRQNRRYRY